MVQQAHNQVETKPESLSEVAIAAIIVWVFEAGQSHIVQLGLHTCTLFCDS
ncbi:MAG TPA: hypothetical protein V6D19_07865 [Stenomitos sp.]